MTSKSTHAAVHAAFQGSSSDAGILSTRARELLGFVLQPFRDEAAAQQAMWELEQLDDYALRDIGLTRYDIQTRMRGTQKRS
jgi:uncharacterized protein YjiS (DUF1127 family)